MPDIDQQKYQLQLFGFMQIIFDHLTPLGFHMLIGLCIAVARQIFIVDFIVNVVLIDGLCLARLRTGPGQRLTVHQSVDQRGFADITFPGECHFGMYILRKLAGNTTDRFQTYILYDHKNSIPALLLRILGLYFFAQNAALCDNKAAPGLFCLFQRFIMYGEGLALSIHCRLGDNTFFDGVIRRNLIHGIHHYGFHNGA